MSFRPLQALIRKDLKVYFHDRRAVILSFVLPAALSLMFGFIFAFVFHHHLLDWLNQALPADRRRPITLGVTEPFVTSIKVSLYAGFALALPVDASLRVSQIAKTASN